METRRVQLVQNGYNPTPVHGKAAILKGWSQHRANEATARQWTRSNPAARNTGIVLGETLVAIDVDILDSALAEELVSIAADLGDGVPLIRIGQAPKTLLLFRTNRPHSKRTTGKYRRAEGEKEQGVEILAAGQQFVADGIHPDTGKPYHWIGASPLSIPADRLPLIDSDMLDSFLRLADDRLGAMGWPQIRPATGVRQPDLFEDVLGAQVAPATIDECKRILADLPTWRCDDRESYIRVGMALHHNFSGSAEGFDLWEQWSRQSSKFVAADIRRDWRSFKERKNEIVTLGTLIDWAQAEREARRERELQNEVEALDDLPPEEQMQESNKPARLQFFTPSQCADLPNRGYVVKGFIAPGDVACLFGAPGAGKSMIAPYLGYAVAQGRQAFGMRTRSGKVFYLPMEDEAGMRQRVRALREQHGDADNFFVVSGVDLASDGGKLDLMREIKRQRPALIVIDTLAAAFPGLEENSSDSMSRVVKLGRELAKFGAAVLFVHHSTKASDGTPRGHSVLNGALDVSMELAPADENGVVRGRLRKNRNGTCERDIAFRIKSHEFGLDEDGDPVTAGYCEPCQPGSAPKSLRLTAPQKEALTILRDMAGHVRDKQEDVPLEAWRLACKQSAKICASENPETVRKAVQRAIEGLLRTGLVAKWGDFVRLDSGDDDWDDDLDDLDEVE